MRSGRDNRQGPGNGRDGRDKESGNVRDGQGKELGKDRDGQGKELGKDRDGRRRPRRTLPFPGFAQGKRLGNGATHHHQ
jgi:hypothetical protein